MGTVVHLDAMNMTLPDVAQIANPHDRVLAKGNIHGKLLPKAEGITRVGKAGVSIGISASYLVVTLPELGREHHTCHWHVCLIPDP